MNKKLRFIGDPIKRIEEDYLRIIRFCRFFGTFSKVDILKNLKRKIIKKVNKISILSNMRVRNELSKILMVKNFELCLSMIVTLQLDKYMLIPNSKSNKINNHSGFKTKDFKVIKYIKKNGLNSINHEKLDLISIAMLHLYNLENIEMIIKRFELNKRKIKFVNFIIQLKNLKLKVNQNITKKLTSKEIELFILKIIWEYRCKINIENKGYFIKDRIPFNWYKLGLLHVLPIEIMKQVDLFNLEWPTLPLTRKKIQDLQDKTFLNKIDDLIFKAENFWVKNNFKSSPGNILIFLKNN
jgi:tRNA nucleotidyltransferase/poly(A) polymerase